MSKKLLLAALLTLCTMGPLAAGTGVIRRAQNGDFVYGRTLEFGTQVVSFDLKFIPRGISYEATSPYTHAVPLKWKTKYAHVGFAPFSGLPLLADGVNEKGLGCGALFMTGWAVFEEVRAEERCISNLDFVSWVLGNFATCAEVTHAVQQTKVVGKVFEKWGLVPPFHFVVVDASGYKAVIEYVDGKLKIYAMPLGTITNSPPYDWHETNAKNYIGLSALNSRTEEVGGHELSHAVLGSGAIGLPGDFTPPSRFIRSSFLREVTLPGKNADEEVNVTFSLLDLFTIPRGAVKASGAYLDVYEVTQWTSAADLSNCRYYFHTEKYRTVRVVDLKKFDPDAATILSISLVDKEKIEDISSRFSAER